MKMDNDFIKSATEAAKLLKTLSHPNRLLVLCYLSEGEMSAGELVLKSDLSFSAFSQHLAILRKAELIKTRRSAQTIYYSIKDPSVLKILLVLKELYCNNLY
ncbi:MAG: ArsR/SmtB family transcription factor [Neisseriaceae bacterium]|jgi:DNA-binding transcriptional ArsR family regulator